MAGQHTRLPIVCCLLAAALASASRSLPAAAATPETTCATTSPRELRVHVVNEANAAPQAVTAAMAEADAIWATAGLRLSWKFPPTPIEMAGGRTVIVVVRRGLSAGEGGADSRGRPHRPLGRLVFGADDRPGHLITVAFDAIVGLVRRGVLFERPVGTLPDPVQFPLIGRGLGRVIAHEIGHWFLGRGHTQAGVMKASFGKDDLVELGVPPLPSASTAAVAAVLMAQP